jgi:uncharacterized protein YuzE
MIRKFKFDYDYENDGLFIYDPKCKSKASVDIDDMIIDYNNKKEVAAIELLNASKFFKDLGITDMDITKDVLNDIVECRIDIIPKNNFFIIRFLLSFNSSKQLVTPVYVPTIHEHSPSLART